MSFRLISISSFSGSAEIAKNISVFLAMPQPVWKVKVESGKVSARTRKDELFHAKSIVRDKLVVS